MVSVRAFAVASFVVLLATLGATPSARAAEQDRTVRVVPRSVDGSGAHDVTAALQHQIDGLPDGSTLRLRRGARYRVDGTLLVAGRSRITIDGAGAEMFAGTRGGGDRAHLRIVGGSQISVRDLKITGSNEHAGLGDAAYVPPMVGQHGIRLEGATDVELARITVTRVFGDFVYIGPDGPRWTEGVWIHDSDFDRSGRQGITVTAGRNIVIERNRISYSHRAIVDLEPNGGSWGAENVHILHNTIGPSRLLFVAAAGRGPVDHVVVAHNTLRGHILSLTVIATPGDRREGFYVQDNTSDTDARRSPIRLTGVDGAVVTGNVQPITRAGEPVVRAESTCSLWVADNEAAPERLQVGPAPSCGPAPRLTAPDPPDVAGREHAAVRRQPRSTTTTSDTHAVAPGSQSEGTSWLRIGLVAGLAILIGALVFRWAWHGDRRANARRRQ